MDQYSTPTTTADSNADGRMVVGVGSGKKCLKCAIKKTVCDGAGGCGKKKKHDGKGGMPAIAPSYGTTASQAAIPSAPKPMPAMTSKSHKASKAIGGLKLKGIKSSSTFSKLAHSKMKLGKSSSRMSSPKALKGMIKGLF